ncbi:Uma2 family endonuclease [Dapis sp. BLCC M229]|uniref:Uma2 family endonuclease n=1 Tax=Dapis sp. BLCC M229 TaxID=3400188 RepID=UPI003CE8ACED
MAVTLLLQQLTIPPGQRLLINNLKWAEFESVLEELGEHRSSRIAYDRGTLEIRMPTPKHEVDKELLGDVVKILLDELEIDCECFGSTTFKGESMESGIEPDQCFYIQNHAQMRGKRRVDLNVDRKFGSQASPFKGIKKEYSVFQASGFPAECCANRQRY